MTISNWGADLVKAAKFFENLHAKKEIRVVTHHGTFHADDVACVAYLINEYPEAKITVVRTREKVADFDLMLDVGREDYIGEDCIKLDHHAPECLEQKYENGVRVSAVAKLLECMYAKKDPMYLSILRKKVIWPISAQDNGQNIEGVFVNPLCWVRYYNPSADCKELADQYFFKAVNTACDILKRIHATIDNVLKDKDVWEKGYSSISDDGVVVLDKPMAWGEYLFNTKCEKEVKLLIFPHATRGWVLRTIPSEEDGFGAKYPLPRTWWGFQEDPYNNDHDMIFCHNTGFMAVFHEQYQAIRAAHYALEKLG